MCTLVHKHYSFADYIVDIAQVTGKEVNYLSPAYRKSYLLHLPLPLDRI